ncbi:MAG: hypothetical protein AB7E55_06740 [Pigmentiphaga sp.]
MNRSLLLVIAILAPIARAGGSATCYTLPADARAFCLARAHGEPSRCYSIQSTEMRATCLAEVRK